MELISLVAILLAVCFCGVLETYGKKTAVSSHTSKWPTQRKAHSVQSSRKGSVAPSGLETQPNNITRSTSIASSSVGTQSSSFTKSHHLHKTSSRKASVTSSSFETQSIGLTRGHHLHKTSSRKASVTSSSFETQSTSLTNGSSILKTSSKKASVASSSSEPQSSNSTSKPKISSSAFRTASSYPVQSPGTTTVSYGATIFVLLGVVVVGGPGGGFFVLEDVVFSIAANQAEVAGDPANDPVSTITTTSLTSSSSSSSTSSSTEACSRFPIGPPEWNPYDGMPDLRITYSNVSSPVTITATTHTSSSSPSLPISATPSVPPLSTTSTSSSSPISPSSLLTSSITSTPSSLSPSSDPTTGGNITSTPESSIILTSQAPTSTTSWPPPPVYNYQFGFTLSFEENATANPQLAYCNSFDYNTTLASYNDSNFTGDPGTWCVGVCADDPNCKSLFVTRLFSGFFYYICNLSDIEFTTSLLQCGLDPDEYCCSAAYNKNS